MSLLGFTWAGVRRWTVSLALACGVGAFSDARAQIGGSITSPEICSGHFPNPFTDVCWGCLFPLTIGAIPLIPGHADAPNPASPICLCSAPPPIFLRIGLEVGFWEPVRLEDVTRKSFCFPDLGGLDIPIPVGYPSMSYVERDGNVRLSGYQVHWYIYPVMYWLELLTDFLCLEHASFDIAYISEFDPTWNDDEVGLILAPETLLFTNPVAQAACAVDCITATVTGLGVPELFWCAGCQGGMTPMVGHVAGEHGQVHGGLLAGERFAYKLHRMLLAEGTEGPAAVCGNYLMPVMDKRQYRFQMINPAKFIPTITSQCPAVGVDTTLNEVGAITPVVGEDLGFLIWRKHNCCVTLDSLGPGLDGL